MDNFHSLAASLNDIVTIKHVYDSHCHQNENSVDDEVKPLPWSVVEELEAQVSKKTRGHK